MIRAPLYHYSYHGVMSEHECNVCHTTIDVIACTKCQKPICLKHREGCDSCWDMFCLTCGREGSDKEWYCTYHADMYDEE